MDKTAWASFLQQDSDMERLRDRALHGLSTSCVLFELSPKYDRPDIKTPSVIVTVNKLISQDDALLFIAPYHSHQDGPLIYDLQGNLVWNGYENSANGSIIRGHNLRPIHHNGRPHLAYSRSTETTVKDVETLVLDSNYNVAERFESSNSFTLIDGHDFKFIQDGSALLQLADVRHEEYKTDAGLRPIVEGVIQVMDVAEKQVLFEWHSLNHVPVSDSCLGLELPDYFHINSLDASASGDYLISGYNACTVYLIDGKTGAILWRLGGSNSSFTFAHDYTLRHVHHVRFQPLSAVKLPSSLRTTISDETHLAISLFDNAFSTTNEPTSSASAAIVILLDLVARTAQVIERYPHPGGLHAAMFGSVDFLPNGHRFVGWGSLAEATQFSRDGDVVWHAATGERREMVGSLKTFKRGWRARPAWRPDGFAYSWVCGWPSVMYASWNGATDVHEWKFYGGNVTKELRLLGQAVKDGFETMMKTREFVRYAVVEAVAVDGEVLGRSRIVKTFVPEVVESRGCGEERCPETLDDWFKDTSDTCFKDEEKDLGGLKDQMVLNSQEL